MKSIKKPRLESFRKKKFTFSIHRKVKFERIRHKFEQIIKLRNMFPLGMKDVKERKRMIEAGCKQLGLSKFITFQVLEQKKFYYQFMFTQNQIITNGEVGFHIKDLDYTDMNFKIPEDYYLHKIWWEKQGFILDFRLKGTILKNTSNMTRIKKAQTIWAYEQKKL